MRKLDTREDYYILCGWMGEDDVKKFLEETKNDDRIFIVVEEDRGEIFRRSPDQAQKSEVFQTI